MSCLRRALALLALMLLTGPLALAQQDPAEEEKRDTTRPLLSANGNIRVGALFTDFDTQIRLDSAIGLGTLILAEDDLGLRSNSSVARIDGFFRWKPKHRVEFGFMRIRREATQVVEEVPEALLLALRARLGREGR